MTTEQLGVRIGNESHESFPAETKFRCLRDQIILEPLDWEPSKIIKVIYHGKPLRGIVKAVGPGCYPKLYDGPKGKRTKQWDSKVFRKTEVKVGDTVELGGLEIKGYLFQTIWWGGVEHVIAREDDVALVLG